MSPIAIDAAALSALKAHIGPDLYSEDPDEIAPHLVEWRDRWRGTTPLFLRPRTTEDVAKMVSWCAKAGAPITVQGGNTGLVGGQIPQGEVLLSLQRLNRIRAVSAQDDILVIEAGATLAAAHAAALGVERHFPLSLASEGSATIGGLAATNAGGVAVLRFGTMRDLTLGIEAVLPDGSIFQGLSRLRKDNTGYDLKNLLIGAEGTLGVVTAAALKLFPIAPSRATALVALADPEAALDLLMCLKAQVGPGLEAFELISGLGLEFALRHIDGCRSPFAAPPPWVALIEIASFHQQDAEGQVEAALASALEANLILDAAVARSEAQRLAFWRLRESQSAAQKPEGAAWKHDVSVPVAEVARFIRQATAAVEAFAPGVRVAAFGHVGDGNVHFDILQPKGGEAARHLALRDQAAKLVHDIVHSMGGSISAEHGLGVMKTAEALSYKPPATVAAQRAIRAALDPGRILNPRVLF